jgi:hypothetical protein
MWVQLSGMTRPAGFVGRYHQLGSVSGVELGAESADVRFHRRHAQMQVGREFGVGEAARHQG